MNIKPQKANFKEIEYEEKKFEKGKVYSRYVHNSKELRREKNKIIDSVIKDSTGFICKKSIFLRKIFYSYRYINKELGYYNKDYIMIFKRGLIKGKLLGTLLIESTKLQKGITRIEFAIK